MTPEKVVAMRADRARGMSYAALGKKYGMRGETSAYKVCNFETWKHVAAAEKACGVEVHND